MHLIMSATVSTDMHLDAELQLAISEHQAGRYEQAEQLYLDILQAQPYHAVANHNLGLLAGQVGQHEAGLPYLLKALSVNPDEGQFWLSYASGLLKAGQPDEALDIVDTAIKRGLDNDLSQALKQQALDAIAAAALLPKQHEIDHIVGLYHAGDYPQMEIATRALLQLYPESAFGWSVLGTALQVQGKDALEVLQKTVELTPDDPEAHSSLGNALQSLGRFDDALASYERALALNPAFVEALSNMGGALQAKGRLEDAADHYRRALAIRPDYALAHFNLGNTFKTQEKFEQAAASYRAALDLVPHDAEIHCNLGSVLHGLEQYEQAIVSYTSALACNPTYAIAHGNIGAALYKLERFDDALASYRSALQLAPCDAEAHNGLGQTLEALKQTDAALASYRSAIAWKPQLAAAHANMGRALLTQDKPDEAVLSYRKVVQLLPDDSSMHSHLAMALEAAGQQQEADMMHGRALELAPEAAAARYFYGIFLRSERRYEAAISILRTALTLDPSDAAIHNALGMTLQADGQLDAAIAAYRQILDIDALSAIAYCNIGSVQQAQKLLAPAKENYLRALELEPRFSGAHFNLGSCRMELGELEEAIESYSRALEIEPSYREAHVNMSAALSNLGRIDAAIEQCRKALALNPTWETVHSNMLFLLAHSHSTDAAEVFAEHLRFGAQFEAPLIAGWPQHANERDPERRLRIGFLSADFNNHALAHFVIPVMEHLARSPRLELFAYYNSSLDDFVTERVRGLMGTWHDVVKLTHEELAQQIIDDGIDIMIDLSGHTGNNRMLALARKPAPLQVSWAGYPMTTGLQAVDYYLTDRYFSPPGMLDHHFTEKLVCLPACAPFLPSHEAPPISEAPAYVNNYITFGSFNRANKLSRSVIARWSKLLRAVPDSRMLLGAMSGDYIRDKLIAWFTDEGITADRLSFHARTTTRDYLAMHRLVDVCLDTFPYTGGTTTFHAAWMGVPTLTMTGATLPSRAGAAILEQLGLTAFVAIDEEDFVAKGKFIADNILFLATLRLGMRKRLADSAMGQPALIASGMENGLRTMWQRWCADLPAEAFEPLGRQAPAIDTEP
jgi:protein O-GlcNAc transferase